MYDCIIIGGGPAGLSAAINLIQRGKKPLICNAGESLLAKAELVDNHIGMPALTGKQMMSAFTGHALKAGAEIKQVKVGNVLPFEGNFMVNAAGEFLEAKTIILAMGVSKSKPVEGESELLGKGVSYCATCDGMLYRNRDVIVWGIAQDAASEANYLCEIGCNVTYIAAKKPSDLNENIVFTKGIVKSINAKENGNVKSVTVNDDEILCDAAFVLRNAAPPNSLLQGLLIEDGSIVVNAACETNIKGVYAAGDIIGKPYQVSNAVGEGLVAGQAAAAYIDENKNT